MNNNNNTSISGPSISGSSPSGTSPKPWYERLRVWPSFPWKDLWIKISSPESQSSHRWNSDEDDWFASSMAYISIGAFSGGFVGAAIPIAGMRMPVRGRGTYGLIPITMVLCKFGYDAGINVCAKKAIMEIPRTSRTTTLRAHVKDTSKSIPDLRLRQIVNTL